MEHEQEYRCYTYVRICTSATTNVQLIMYSVCCFRTVTPSSMHAVELELHVIECLEFLVSISPRAGLVIICGLFGCKCDNE